MEQDMMCLEELREQTEKDLSVARFTSSLVRGGGESLVREA